MRTSAGEIRQFPKVYEDGDRYFQKRGDKSKTCEKQLVKNTHRNGEYKEEPAGQRCSSGVQHLLSTQEALAFIPTTKETEKDSLKRSWVSVDEDMEVRTFSHHCWECKAVHLSWKAVWLVL